MSLGMRDVIEAVSRRRFAAQAGFDGLMWIPSLWVAVLLRYDLDPSQVPVGGVAAFCALAFVLQVLIGRASGLYIHRWRYATFEEIVAMARATLLTTAALTVTDLLPWLDRPVPLSTPVTGCLS